MNTNEKETMKVKIKKLHDEAIIPTRNNPTDSGLDLYALFDTLVDRTGTTSRVLTGIAFEIPEGYEIQVRPRSGLSLKTGLRVANSPGTVDRGYQGDCSVLLYSCDNQQYKINKGDRIGQAVFVPVMIPELEVVFDFDEPSYRGDRGFGSSGD